jgi:iron complex outermembrane recepter protein
MNFVWRSLNPRLIFCIWFTVNASLLSLPAYAQKQSNNTNDSQNKISNNSQQDEPLSVDKLPPTSTARDLWAQAKLVKITSVQIDKAQSGLEVILETASGNLTAPIAQSQGKILYFDIPNATLALSDGKEFRVDNPVKGIANISVTQANASYVRVILTGIDVLPTSQISSNAKGLVIGTSAIAPEPIAQNPSASDDREEDITITGDRRRTPSTGSKTDIPLRDIPASVQTIPKEVIKDTGSNTLDAIIRSAPSVQQASQSNYGFANTYSIRGLTQSFLRDGVPDGLAINGYFRTLTDVESIEILKGPGSSLFGSLAPGGTINLISKKPQSIPAYDVNFTAGSFGTYGGNIDFTGALTDDKTLLYRFNGAYNTTDGYRGARNTSIEILPKIAWKPNEFNTLNFSFDYRSADVITDSQGIPFRGVAILDVPRDTRYYSPFSQSTQSIYRGAINHEWQVNPDLVVRNNLIVLYRNLVIARNTTTGFNTTTNPDGSSNYLTTLANRGFRDQIDNALDLTYQTEAVLKVLTGEIKHTILAGIEYQYKNYTSVRDTSTFRPPTNILNPVLETSRNQRISFVRDFDIRQQANYTGIYAQDQIEFSEQLKARFGGRFDIFGINRTGTVGSDKNSYSQAPSAFSYQVGLVYQPTREVSLYGGISKNYLAALSTEGVTSVFDPPESALQYELGAKAELFDGRLAVNLAFFDITRENFIITINDVRQPIGAQKTRGIELDFNAKPLDGWNIYGGLSLYDAKLTNLPNTRIFEGNRPVGVPATAASIGTSYEIQSGDFKGLGFGGGLTYRDSIFTTNDNRRSLPAYTTLDLVLFYRQKTFEAQLNFYNVTNTEYFRNGSNGGGLPGTPFTVSATVGFKF